MRMKLFLAAAVPLVTAACVGLRPAARPPEPSSYPAARFAVVADPHLFDVSSSLPGPAWDRELGSGMKLLAESAEILAECFGEVGALKPDFILIPGDLTKDGERASHLLMARALSEMESSGIPVLVVPGNHDILNPHAALFRADKREKTDSITPGEFSTLYADFGYREAMSRDPASLSYAAEPVEGLWVIGIDACRYGEKQDHPVTEGRLRGETAQWLSGLLGEAAAGNKTVIAFMHYGAMEHFQGQDSYLGQYVVADHANVASLLSRGGVRAVFTGHGHAQDITLERFPDGGFLFDVETGSLSSYPNPYRMASLSAEGILDIESSFISSIPSRPAGFTEYSRRRLREGVMGSALPVLERVCVTGESARLLAGQAAETAETFYRGDEPGREATMDTAGMDCWTAFVSGFLAAPISALGTDLIPVDNGIRMDLHDGAWRPD